MKRHSIKNENGFTLVELLTAIAIIVAITAIAAPIYLKFEAGAKHSEANTNLSGIKLSQEGYWLANGTYLDCTQHPAVAPTETSQSWAGGNANFNSIGFGASANVNFVYEVIDSSVTGFVALAHGDTDGDGNTTHFIATKYAGPSYYSGETLTAAPSITIDGTPDED